MGRYLHRDGGALVGRNVREPLFGRRHISEEEARRFHHPRVRLVLFVSGLGLYDLLSFIV
jgi:hypothetical protein